jgi:hypothetical protein
MVRNLITTAAAAALVAAPVAAQAAPARTSSPIAAEEDLEGNSWILPAIIGVGLAIVIYLIIDSEDDLPTSP